MGSTGPRARDIGHDGSQTGSIADRTIGHVHARLASVVFETKAYVMTRMNLAAAYKRSTVIDSRYPLQDIVEAHRHVESGREVGKVIVTMEGL